MNVIPCFVILAPMTNTKSHTEMDADILEEA